MQHNGNFRISKAFGWHVICNRFVNTNMQITIDAAPKDITPITFYLATNAAIFGIELLKMSVPLKILR